MFVKALGIPRKDQVRQMARYVEAMRPTEWELELQENQQEAVRDAESLLRQRYD